MENVVTFSAVSWQEGVREMRDCLSNSMPDNASANSSAFPFSTPITAPWIIAIELTSPARFDKKFSNFVEAVPSGTLKQST